MIFISKLKATNSNSDRKDSVNNGINNNLINNAIDLNVIFFHKPDGRYSKSEIPNNFTSKKTSYNEVKDILNSNHKISKSEMFNLQIDLKKILDELEKKKKIEEEKSKIKVSRKKRLILDKFFKCKINN